MQAEIGLGAFFFHRDASRSRVYFVVGSLRRPPASRAGTQRLNSQPSPAPTTNIARRRREYRIQRHADGRPSTKAVIFDAEGDTRLLSPRFAMEDDNESTLAFSDRDGEDGYDDDDNGSSEKRRRTMGAPPTPTTSTARQRRRTRRRQGRTSSTTTRGRQRRTVRSQRRRRTSGWLERRRR